MPNLPEIPRKNLPRTAETTDLHAHRDNSSGGRISARDLLEPQALVDPLAGALLDGSMHTDTLAAAVSRGSMIVGNATPLWSEFVIGAASTLLTTNGTDPSWSKVALLSAFHSDTLANNPTRGDLIVANSTPAWARFAVGAANRVLRSDGLDPSWGQLDLTTDVTGVLPLANGGTSKNLTAANGGIVYSDSDSLEILAATATAGQVLRSGSNAAPSWSTATYPATAGTSGNLLVSDGTNWNSAAASALASAEFLDSAFRIIGSSDGTKKIGFEVDGNTAGTTRIYTVKDANGTIPLLGTTNLWTGSNQFSSGSLQVFDLTSTYITTLISGATGGGPFIVYLPITDGGLLAYGGGTGGDQPSAGAIPYGLGSTQSMAALSIGTAGQILRVNAGATAPEWVAATTAADVARTWGTLQTFPDDKLLIVGSTTASKTLRFELDGSTANADLVLDYRSAVDRSLIWNLSGGTGGDLTMAWAGTASATLTLPTASDTLIGRGTTDTITGAKTFGAGAATFGAGVDDEQLVRFVNRFDTGTSVPGFIEFWDSASGAAGGPFAGYLNIPAAGITATRQWSFPDASGTFMLGVGGLVAGRVAFLATSGSTVGISGDSDLTFSGSTLTATNIAAHGLTGNMTVADGINFVLNTTTGTKIGTGTTQKLGFWNSTPVVQNAGWTMTNVTTDKTLDADSTTLAEVADVLGTLIDTLKTYGLLGA